MNAMLASVVVVAVAVCLCWAILWTVSLVIVIRTNSTAGLRDVAVLLKACREVFSFGLSAQAGTSQERDPPTGAAG